MSWLSSWMRDVIMIVLLATFVDMILPSRSMERYVKLVLSLLILFALLHPIIALLTDQPAAKLSQAMSFLEQGGTDDSGLKRILAEADQLRSQQQSQSLQFAAEEVAKQMSQQIREATGEQVKEIKVSLGLQESKDTPYISQVNVILNEAVTASDTDAIQTESGKTEAAIHIAPVEPVNINVSLEDAQEVGSPAEPTMTEDADTEKVKQLLLTHWGLTNEQIKVLRAYDESA